MGKTLGTYDFPSRSALENYGGDMLVNIFIKGRSLLPCAAMVRVPQTMTWDEFVATQVRPLLAIDAYADPTREMSFELVGRPLTADPAASLVDNGVRHKNTIAVVTS